MTSWNNNGNCFDRMCVFKSTNPQWPICMSRLYASSICYVPRCKDLIHKTPVSIACRGLTDRRWRPGTTTTGNQITSTKAVVVHQLLEVELEAIANPAHSWIEAETEASVEQVAKDEVCAAAAEDGGLQVADVAKQDDDKSMGNPFLYRVRAGHMQWAFSDNFACDLFTYL